MAKYENICKYIHLPVQSGSSAVLERMNRTYDREWYMQRMEAIRRILPTCAVSSDIIAGFCGETEADHEDTLSIMQFSDYSMSYMFFYSERPGTLAARKYADDVPLEVKKRRLDEIIRLQNQLSFRHNQRDLGKYFKVLVEKPSRKSEEEYAGRNTQNKMIVFPKGDSQIGHYAYVKVTDCTQATLKGHLVTEAEWASHQGE
jgi:tRNA-2-methylthio-N6-dimethylallyladenosine synthase